MQFSSSKNHHVWQNNCLHLFYKPRVKFDHFFQQFISYPSLFLLSWTNLGFWCFSPRLLSSHLYHISFVHLFDHAIYLLSETCSAFPLDHWLSLILLLSSLHVFYYKNFQTHYWVIWILCAAKSLQSCPTLCDPIDGSPPGSAVPGILQARTLECVAISFSNAWKWKVKVKSLSRVLLLATPWTAAHQAPPSVGFSRQEYWSGVPWPSPMNSLYVEY